MGSVNGAGVGWAASWLGVLSGCSIFWSGVPRG
jgi:hypothetical protein